MISKLDDVYNNDLLRLLEDVLKLSAFDLTRMSDSEVLAIFNKLSFQCRQCVGVFSDWNLKNQWENTINQIDSEIANMELLQ